VAFRDSATSDGAGGTPTASEKRTEHFQKEVKNLKEFSPMTMKSQNFALVYHLNLKTYITK